MWCAVAFFQFTVGVFLAIVPSIPGYVAAVGWFLASLTSIVLLGAERFMARMAAKYGMTVREAVDAVYDEPGRQPQTSAVIQSLDARIKAK